jgi:hypothetical protein
MSTYQYVLSKGHPNVQDYVNNGPDHTVNPIRLKEITDFMLSNGWSEIDVNNYASIGSGSLIKYVTNDNTTKGGMRLVEHRDVGEEELLTYGSFAKKFRSGGWFVKWDTGENGDYILYKPHNKNQPPVPVQVLNIERLFVMTAAKQSENRRPKKGPVAYARPGDPTNYPVYLIDSNNNKVVVYYAKDKYKQTRFMETEKYANAKQYGWAWY